MQVTSILWFTLGLFVIGLGMNAIRLYSIDKDLRKLVYGLGLSFSSLSFLLFSGGYLNHYSSISNNVFLHTIYLWSGTVYQILIFHVLLKGIFTKKIKIKNSLISFIILSSLSFLLLFTGLANKDSFIVGMGVGTIINIVLAVLYTIKYKELTSYLFLLSIFSILIASSQIQLIILGDVTSELFSLFAFYIGYIFIAIIFLSSSSNLKKNRGIDSFFSIEKQLQSAKKELSETKEMFRDLFNQMVDSVIIVDRKGTVLEASNRFFSDLQINRDDAIGKNLFSFDFIDTQTKRLLIKNIMLRLAGKHIPPYEITAYPKNGKPIPYEIHAGKVQYNGRPADMAVFRNLSERKKAEKIVHEAEVRYKTIFAKTGTAMGTFGNDGIIKKVNNKFSLLTGYSKDEVEGKMYWYDLITDKDKKRMLEYHKNRLNKKNAPPSEYDCSMIDKTGTIKIVHVTIGVIPDTDIRIVSLNDITPLKEMHDKLERMNKDLELTVDQRTQQIQALLKQKDEFINQLGHDLKNPLGPLLNLIPLLEKRETDPKYKEMLVVMHRNISYMKNLVVKTIELAKLNAQSISFTMESIDLVDCINMAISANQLSFKEKQIDVVNTLSSPLVIEADMLRIQEVFVNVFSNAIKYSNPQGYIEIDKISTKDHVTITVKDTGIGMTPKQMAHIFDEFYKADESRHDFDSTGLGMPICKRIVEKHGGKIWVESQGIGKGSIFFIKLPIKQVSYIKKSEVTGYVQDMHRRIDEIIA